MSLSTPFIDHITMGSFMGKGNQYIELVKIVYCKLPTNGKQLPAFLGQGTKPPISEVGGESATTGPPCPLSILNPNIQIKGWLLFC